MRDAFDDRSWPLELGYATIRSFLDGKRERLRRKIIVVSRENGSNNRGKKEGIGEIFEPKREHAGKVSARLAR